MIKIIYLLLMAFLINVSASAKGIKSLVLFYDEIEQGVGVQNMRYIINENYLRIDDGKDNADFILFDVKQKIIFSINHEDQTILKIENNSWQRPQLSFEVDIKQQLMPGAPKVFNQAVYSYVVNANDMACTQVSFVKDKYLKDMQVLYLYQQVLSGQQVATLKNTPKDMHTPCFLIDQVYHAGEYYKLGLPIHISYSRGYEKFLKSFKEMELDKSLFIKPEKYEEYKAAF
ncbi:hypothetical protein MNBD_GAMMA08-751 [hydrothermal vent metagenome]|uniref:Uncharacterized protein n=1 Tax=hydrothermal vent metagenome TaxID=652676 RepID=A0A3B0X2M7_9ZZZZ